jgi:hypothetical protein
MGIFRRNVPRHFVPVHPYNIASKDWVILLEAGTIIGPTPEKLRVARFTQDKKLVSTATFCWADRSTTWSWKTTIRESTPCISAHNFTSMTLTRSLYPCRAKKSAD